MWLRVEGHASLSDILRCVCVEQVGLTQGLWPAIRECGLMLVGSILVQFVCVAPFPIRLMSRG
eukprot:3692879-Rhodomonas_salina.3